jgi:hypothetical protein
MFIQVYLGKFLCYFYREIKEEKPIDIPRKIGRPQSTHTDTRGSIFGPKKFAGAPSVCFCFKLNLKTVYIPIYFILSLTRM